MTIEWTTEDASEATAQGWDIVYADSRRVREIERIDEMEKFTDDCDAVIFVTQEALKGSKLAQKALQIHWAEWK